MLIPSETVLKQITLEKLKPITFAFSRLEARPRTNNFDRALKAEVRDALWMLTKQWQLGEFEGDDAGSPIVAKLSVESNDLEKYKADDQPVQAFDKEVPFEAKVEQRPIPFSVLAQNISLDVRLIMGRRWFQLLDNKGILTPAVRQFFLTNYGFSKPDPANKDHAAICAHQEAWQQFAAVAGRMVDGARLYFDLGAAVHYYNQPGFPAGIDHGDLDKAEEEWKAWYTDLFYQPADAVNDAWEPSRLEYQFAISSRNGAAEKVMHAEQYYQGHLDWYNVDVDPTTPTLGDLPGAPPVAKKIVQSIIPAPVMFEGMPNTRWWAFEDSRTNFSYVKPDTPDLAKLIMMEFGLVYANDWYLIPYKLPVGTVNKIKGLTVTNSFGENFWIDAADAGPDSDPMRWDMFSLKTDSPRPVAADTDMLLLPTVSKIQESDPLEEVLLVRDEMANMVWGVECIIPLASGTGKSGFEAADEYHNLLQKLITDQFGTPGVEPPVADGEEIAKIRYEVMNTIPENWIPFIPTHIEGSNREIQLQRAAMPRMLDGNPNPPDKIRPRTSLLQVGLEKKQAYYLHEEEVPRSGIRVIQSYQRTRWSNGKVFVWFGARKTNGRGESSSGLAFDRIVAKNTGQ